MSRIRRIATFAATIVLFTATVFAAVPEAPTYSKDVAPILNEKCVQCHRPGQSGPMSLQSYEEVRPWVKSILRNVGERVMPPWHASASYGKLVNDRSLDPSQIDTIVRWVKRGAPEGNPVDLPEPPTFAAGGWRLGTPDHVVEFPEVEVPAGGPDQFHDLVGKLMLPEDRWVRAIEILPSNPKVAHHAIVIQIKGFKEPDPSAGWLGAWAAGAEPMVFPSGTARLIKKGANLIGDMHYHPADTPEKDRTRVGLYFAEEAEVEKALVNLWVWNQGFEIPPGDPNYEVKASYTFLQGGKIMGFAPHMHYRGKDFKYTATFPDGRQELLLAVDKYDFNWQTVYTLEEPIPVPEGTRIDCVAHYDNSPQNPDNPDPTKSVTFGDESYDEMMIGFIDWVAEEGVHPESPADTRRRILSRLAAEHPGEAYAVYSTDPERATPLHLASQGAGVLYLTVSDHLTPCRVFDIRWDGASFAAKVDVPNYRVLDLRGNVDREAGTIETTLVVNEERELSLNGKLAKASLTTIPSGGR